MSKEDLIKAIKEYTTTNKRNLMGCSEDWYDFVYAIKKTFTIEEIEEMSEKEIEHLITLAKNIAEALY